jgi:polyisoprenoid-binding protein YceI
MKPSVSSFFLLALLAMLPLASPAQVFFTKTGQLHFFSETPLENIEAVSKKAECAFMPATGQVSARILVNTYTFDKALMQRHFNENYLETDKYPHSSLEGKLTEPLNLKTNGTQTLPLLAKLTMHGVVKEYTIPCQIEVKDGKPVHAKGKFKVKLADHNIDIPTIVIKQIAEVIDVDFDFALEPKK